MDDLPNNVEVENSRSVLDGECRNKIISEILEGNYIMCCEKPKVISSLCAVPKPDGDIRL